MRIDRIVTENNRNAYLARKSDAKSSFQSAMIQAASVTGSFTPASSQQVTDAWNAAKEKTGIDPLPMNKISTPMVLYAESGRQGSFSSFLGRSKASAIQIAEQIIFRLNNPIAPVEDVQFAKDELAFYRCFLKNLTR